MTKMDWGKTLVKDAGALAVLLYVLAPRVQTNTADIANLGSEIADVRVQHTVDIGGTEAAAKAAMSGVSRRVDYNLFSIQVLARKVDSVLPEAPPMDLGRSLREVRSRMSLPDKDEDAED